jgi:hypothetical protein
MREAVALAGKEFGSAPAKALVDFVATTKRGICADVGEANRGEAAE